MKYHYLALTAAALMLATVNPAIAEPFSGPYVSLEGALEDLDTSSDRESSYAILGGWDFRIGETWVAGAALRVTIDGASASETTPVTGGNLLISKASVEDQVGVSARIGRIFGDRVLVFAEGGLERFEVKGSQTIRSGTCTTPNGCEISRDAFSSTEEMWTIGAGAELALTDRWSLRASYDYGESDAFDRNRLRFGASFHF